MKPILMLQNYLIASIRNLLRFKSHSIINIVGLSVGLATSILIFLWVFDELSFDQFHEKSNRIYRVMGTNVYPDGKMDVSWATSAMLAPVIPAQAIEIDQVTQVSWDSEFLIQNGASSLNGMGLYADSSMFSIFTFPIVKGLPQPMVDLKSMAISEKLSKSLFGDEEPLGKVLRVNRMYDLTITGVFANVPQNSTLQFDLVIPFELWLKENDWALNWTAGGMQTFATLRPGTSLETANQKLSRVIVKNCAPCTNHPFLFPYSSLHLHSEFVNGKNSGGRISQINLFSAVAAIILLIACINFMNLATARAATRSREVGVRKSLGAQQRGLMFQFMLESVLMSFLALVFALALVQLLLPLFNEVTEKSLGLDFTNYTFVTGIILIALATGFLAGSYPAMFLSSFKPAAVLKGNTQSLFSGGGLRKALVVTQFIASAILITGSVTIYHQITFINNKNLGFEKDNVVVINELGGIRKNHEAFKNDLLQYPAIRNIGFSVNNPFAVFIDSRDAKWPGMPPDASVSFKVIPSDEGFIPAMRIRMLEGRNFTAMNRQDSTNYIVNRQAMAVMGLNEANVIGAELSMWNGNGKIVGLVEDFNSNSLREKIEPLIFLYRTSNTQRVFIKIDAKADQRVTLGRIESAMKKYETDFPFQYSFLNEDYEREYESEAVIGKLALCFTAVAVLISCLGLFGLASFTAERRKKELGVRKVLGATTVNLVTLLCGDFARLVLMALLVAGPAAWYLAQHYLDGFAYHADLGILDFVLPSAGMLVLTLLTVGKQSIEAALENPVNSLRSE